MIMKKFETLERLKANVQASTAPAAEGEDADGAAAAAGPEAAAAAAVPLTEAQLTEEQLMEVFKQTSQFTVKAAMGNELAGARRSILPHVPREQLVKRGVRPLIWRRTFLDAVNRGLLRPRRRRCGGGRLG